MIASDNELHVTQDRIAYFQQWLVNLRQTARPDELASAAGGCRLEIERMQAAVMNYYIRPLAAAREESAFAH